MEEEKKIVELCEKPISEAQERVVSSGTATIENTYDSSNKNLEISIKNNTSITGTDYTSSRGTYRRSYSVITGGNARLVIVNYYIDFGQIIADYWSRAPLPADLGINQLNSTVLVTYNKPNSSSYPPKEFIATLDESYVYVTSDADDSGSTNMNLLSLTVISIQA